MTENNYEELEPQETPETESEEGEEGEGEDLVEKLQKELEEVKAKYEKARADKNGLLKKVKTKPAQGDTDRYDRLELRILDKDLTADQISEILTYSKAKGITADEAYNSRIIQSFLKEAKEDAERERKLKEATPKAAKSGAFSKPQIRQFSTQNRTGKGLSVEDAAAEIERRMFS
jgi:hypothetical protein